MKLDFTNSVAICKKCEKDEFWQMELEEQSKPDINK